jgi:hypothetical protein
MVSRSIMLDAARYRWLRQQHWSDGPLCVVLRPREAVKLGYFCPSLEYLDDLIDAEMGDPGMEADVADLARRAGLYDALGDGTRWQSQDGPSVSTADLELLLALAAGAETAKAPDVNLEQAVREWNDSLPAGTLGEVHIGTLLGRVRAALGVKVVGQCPKKVPGSMFRCWLSEGHEGPCSERGSDGVNTPDGSKT